MFTKQENLSINRNRRNSFYSSNLIRRIFYWKYDCNHFIMILWFFSSIRANWWKKSMKAVSFESSIFWKKPSCAEKVLDLSFGMDFSIITIIIIVSLSFLFMLLLFSFVLTEVFLIICRMLLLFLLLFLFLLTGTLPTYSRFLPFYL